MRLALVGDVHGEIGRLETIYKRIEKDYPEVQAIIQVGDFGISPSTSVTVKKLENKIPIYFIDGNHEYFPYLKDLTEVTAFGEQVFYVPRGTVLELAGKRIAFMGGAASVDKEFRLANGWSWYKEENITDAQFARLDHLQAGDIDILVTHTPPHSIIRTYLNPLDLEQYFNLPRTWVDPNALKVQELWDRLGNPSIYSGHLHVSINHDTCRVLNINEIYITD